MCAGSPPAVVTLASVAVALAAPHLVPGLTPGVALRETEGVRAALARGLDVVVMDLEMPGLDGLQATRHLREHRLTSAMPVIVASAHAGAEYRERAEAAGCDGYLAKPCPPAELLGGVERVLRARLATAV